LKGRNFADEEEFLSVLSEVMSEIPSAWFCGCLPIGVDGCGVFFWWKETVLSNTLTWSDCCRAWINVGRESGCQIPWNFMQNLQPVPIQRSRLNTNRTQRHRHRACLSDRAPTVPSLCRWSFLGIPCLIGDDCRRPRPAAINVPGLDGASSHIRPLLAVQLPEFPALQMHMQSSRDSSLHLHADPIRGSFTFSLQNSRKPCLPFVWNFWVDTGRTWSSSQMSSTRENPGSIWFCVLRTGMDQYLPPIVHDRYWCPY
jgi:hypothetical protein